MTTLKHSFIYVLELHAIVSPSKARLAFLNQINQCPKFHYYCKYCGVKLKGRNINKTRLEITNQQPHCSDWPNVKHKDFCECYDIDKTRHPSGGGSGVPPLDTECFVPEYLSFEPPLFVIKKPDKIPDEISLEILYTAPTELNIKELAAPKSTYFLKDVLVAYHWLIKQNLSDNDYPKIKLGNRGYDNRYKYLLKSFNKIIYNDSVIYFGNFEIQYATKNDKYFSFNVADKINKKINDSHIICYTKIVVPLDLCVDTELYKALNKIIATKQDKLSKIRIAKFYIAGHPLPAQPIKKLSSHGNPFYQFEIEINNPYLLVLTVIDNMEIQPNSE